MSDDDNLDYRFQNLHEFVKVARQNLNRNNWDYIVGATETETTIARNRQSLDCLAFRPRVLRNVQKVNTSSTFYGRKVRLPVLIAPVGGLQLFWPGGVAEVAAAAGEFGIPMMQSSATEPALEETAKRAPKADKVFQLQSQAWRDARSFFNGWVESFVLETESRAIWDLGFGIWDFRSRAFLLRSQI